MTPFPPCLPQILLDNSDALQIVRSDLDHLIETAPSDRKDVSLAATRHSDRFAAYCSAPCNEAHLSGSSEVAMLY